MSKVLTNYVMIGNPGVGKSTILNALMGKVEFESGLSFGAGMTSVCQRKTNTAGMVFIDTPGLSDIDMRKKAAEEITEALRSEGYFRIFFVITLESGRLRPDDLVTMKLVLESAPIGNNYSVIVNQLPQQAYAMLQQGNNREKLEAGINRAPLPGTTSIYHNVSNDALVCKNNELHELPSALAKFISSAPIVAIAKANVQPIKEDNFEALRQEYGKIIEQLQKDNAAMNKALQENQAKMLQIQKENNDKLADLQTSHSKELKKMLAEQTRQLKKISEEKANKVPMANPEPPAPVASPSTSAPEKKTSGLGVIVGTVCNVIAPGSGPYVEETISNWMS